MKGTFFAFIAVALFSLYAVFGKLLLEGVSPFVILIVNQVLAGIVVFLAIDVFKKIKEFKETKKHDYTFMFLISIFSAVLGPLLFLFGLSLTSATNSVLIGKSEAVLTSIIAIYFLKDKISFHQILGSVIMFFGVFVIATNNFALGLSFQLGDVIIFLSALSFAVGTILFKKFMGHVPPEIIVGLRSFYGAFTLFLISFFFVDFGAFASVLSLKFILTVFGLVILTTVAGQYLWYKALEMTSATNVSLAGLCSPLIAVIYTTLLLGEKLASSQILGGAIIIVGLVILEVHFRKHHTNEKRKHHLKLKHWPHI